MRALAPYKDEGLCIMRGMVRAIFEGRKFQTRRLLKIRGHKTYSEFGTSDTAGYEWHFRDSEMRWHDLRDSELKSRLPHMVGDHLWVREAWRTECSLHNDLSPSDMSGEEVILFDADGDWASNKSTGRARASMHMPRWASRLTLPVVGVRVQRLHAITAEDAIAEGLHQNPMAPQYAKERGCDWTYPGETRVGSPVSAFAALWNSINAERGFGWDVNPWVVATTFETHHCNIDQLEAA